ncbi:MAG: cobalamin biosynthesis protein [Methanomassiliicoccaceae archaeon]|jgi:cobalt-precorrin 5A hydrolase|nr:cobalamin biosynthesis protein [Methanomassiliicoccaceae archaeon]
MRIGIIAFSSRGCALAERISKELNGHECSRFAKTTGEKHGAEPVVSMKEWTAGSFKECGAIIFIGAAGIAVRYIAPYVRDKSTDPAVIVADELGRNIIPILSGHIGGANRLAAEIGAAIGGNVVITTATDLNDVFAVDVFAAENDMHIDNVAMVKQISARLLEGKPVHMMSDVRIEGDLPEGVTYADAGDTGIYITASVSPNPFKRTLRLVPRMMTLGVGSHRDIDAAVFEGRVLEVLGKNDISVRAVRAGGSIDLKRNESGILEFFKKYDIPMTFFSKEELERVKGEFTASDYVKTITGVENVCERSAIALSDNGTIIVRKVGGVGVTVAVAKDDRVIRFGDVR